MNEVRQCAQCGTPFAPRREHARFCSARCRMAWNSEHVGVAATPVAAIDWSVAAMAESASRFAAAQAWDLRPTAAAVGETVWWVTLVDATLVRYYPRLYENALASQGTRRRKIEGTLEGLRYVRNTLGDADGPAGFIAPACGDAVGWIWRRLPPPDLEDLTPDAREWELSRYRAYETRLAGRDIASAFFRCARFLTDAAGLACAPARTRTPA